MQSFVIKRGDTLPSLQATLEDVSGAVNLTGATVQLRVWSSVTTVDSNGCETTVPGSSVFTKAGVVVDAVTGKVAYNWASGDTANTGLFLGEFVATFTGGAKQSFPTSGYIPITVNASLS